MVPVNMPMGMSCAHYSTLTHDFIKAGEEIFQIIKAGHDVELHLIRRGPDLTLLRTSHRDERTQQHAVPLIHHKCGSTMHGVYNPHNAQCTEVSSSLSQLHRPQEDASPCRVGQPSQIP